MRPKAIAWDIDGTLVDSEPLHLAALLATCDAHNVDISNLPDDHFVGISLYGVWDALKDQFPLSMDLTEWTKQQNRFYHENSATLHPIPGAVETMQVLHQMGIKQVAVSNSNRVIVDTNLAVLGVSEMMQFSVSLDDVSTGKPDPAPYLLAAKKLNLGVCEILAVEDSLTGIKSAQAAGIKVAGYQTPDTDLAQADIVVLALKNLLSVVT